MEPALRAKKEDLRSGCVLVAPPLASKLLHESVWVPSGNIEHIGLVNDRLHCVNISLLKVCSSRHQAEVLGHGHGRTFLVPAIDPQADVLPEAKTSELHHLGESIH
eukprot:CAMPEP_0180819476 /NCGR_PEP_ID=MMETSP1038_2-20121128/69761_1 /TAXON_ID=632150 /ORGANISM="Azadinium spinosum, Strain 3D9" /LENGTH=105 /DNA_ID=CAMNT_0022861481 /DNA_START=532 /DNA_END=850 /DNA_ORIENTATION=-